MGSWWWSAESSAASGMGAAIEGLEGEPHRTLFSESPSRAVVSCSPDDVDAVLAIAADLSIEAHRIGATGGTELAFPWFSVALEELVATYEGALEENLSDTMT